MEPWKVDRIRSLRLLVDHTVSVEHCRHYLVRNYWVVESAFLEMASSGHLPGPRQFTMTSLCKQKPLGYLDLEVRANLVRWFGLEKYLMVFAPEEDAAQWYGPKREALISLVDQIIICRGYQVQNPFSRITFKDFYDGMSILGFTFAGWATKTISEYEGVVTITFEDWTRSWRLELYHLSKLPLSGENRGG